jgi:hypothetical protein
MAAANTISSALDEAFLAAWGGAPPADAHIPSQQHPRQQQQQRQLQPSTPEAAAALKQRRALLAAVAAQSGHAINGLQFVTTAPGAEPACPPSPIPGATQSLIATNIKRGAAGASSDLYACVSTGPTGPFIASLQLTPPGANCPSGAAPLPANLNAGVPGAPRVLACVASTPDAGRALKALRVAFSDRGAGAKCGAGFTAAPGDANAGAAGALSAFFCTTNRDTGLISLAVDPAGAGAGGRASTLLVHPLSEGLDSCLTIAGGAANPSARGLRVTPWPCRGAAPGAFQQWVFVPKGGDR